MNEDYNKLLEEKIDELESNDYIFPKRFSVGDYLIVGLVCVVSLIFIIIGARL